MRVKNIYRFLLIFIFIPLQLVFVCCSHKTNRLYGYKIINKQEHDYPNLTKILVTAVLDSQLTKVQIQQVITEIQENENANKDKQFYFFYLPQMDTTRIAWANAQVDHNKVDICIFGASKENEIKQKEQIAKVSQRDSLLGKWYSNNDFFATSLIKKDNNYFIKTIYSNLSSGEDEVLISNEKGLTTIRYKDGGYHGEYFYIDKKGNLHTMKEDGKCFDIAEKLE